MSKLKPAIRVTPPLSSARKTARASKAPSAHAKRMEAEKQALLALEHSLRLQAYIIGLPRTNPLFSGNDQRRSVFPSAPASIVRIQNDK